MLRLIHHVRHGLQAKPRVALTVGLGIFAAAAIYTFTRPKIYEATASVSFWEPRGGFSDAADDDSTVDTVLVYSGRFSDLNPPIIAASSDSIAQLVADKLTANEIHAIIPSATEAPDAAELLKHLKAARRVTPLRLSGLVAISFRNSDPSVAQHVAILFAKELQTWAKNRRSIETRRRVEELALPTSQQSPQSWNPRSIHRLLTEPSPSPSAYVEPDIPRNLSIGLFAGLVLGTTAASFAARSTPSPTRVPEV